MMNTNAFMASTEVGLGLTIALTTVSVLIFLMAVVFVWWVDVKKRPLKDMFAQIKNGFWFMFEQIYSLFSTNSTVKTVYSDKARNYSGTEFLPIPTKAPTNQYTYEFVGWDKNGVDEKGNMVVKAIYLQKVIKCYINVFDDDRETLLKSEVVEYGAGITLDELRPTKPETKEFAYEFVGWDKDISAFYKNENVYAVYNAIPKKYSYKFVEDDGTSVISQGTAIYGTPIIPPADPQKASDKNEVCEFVGWKNYVDGMVLTKDVTFVAMYSVKPVGEPGTSMVIKTDGKNVKVVTESALAESEDREKDNARLSRLASAIKFDTGKSSKSAQITEVKTESGAIRKTGGIVIQKNISSEDKFRELNANEVQHHTDDQEIHQKIQLMTIKKTAEVEDNSKVIKLKPKPETEPDENDLLKNMMINKIKIDSVEDKKDDE